MQPTDTVRALLRKSSTRRLTGKKDSVMKELLLFGQTLVDNPDEVRVTETEGPEAIILELNVAQDDMGR